MKKTIYELAREFPEKTYKELEKYRDADRQEEAAQIPLTESQQKQEELEPIEGKEKKKIEGTCITAALRKDRTYPDLTEVLAQENAKLKKRTQEAEGELGIIKGIGNTSPEMKEKDKIISELKEEIGNLNWIKQNDYKFLIEENRAVHLENEQLKENNKKLIHQIENQLNKARKAGL